jgi:predicted DNA-binding transcriptional regulator AlpA
MTTKKKIPRRKIMSAVPATPLRLYRIKELANVFHIDRATLWRWRREGTFPKPIAVGGVLVWTEQQLAAFLAERVQEASNG